MAPATLLRLLPALEPVALNLRQTHIARDVPTDAVYFPLAGVVSLVSTLDDGTIVEVVTLGDGVSHELIYDLDSSSIGKTINE